MMDILITPWEITTIGMKGMRLFSPYPGLLQTRLSGIYLFLFTFLCFGCSQQPSQETTYKPQTAVEVVFFHTNYRCESCEAIKSETRKALKELYGDEVHFAMYNLDEQSGRKTAQSLGIKAQALLIISGQGQTDITGVGYVYAHANPSIYKQKLKENIDTVLK